MYAWRTRAHRPYAVRAVDEEHDRVCPRNYYPCVLALVWVILVASMIICAYDNDLLSKKRQIIETVDNRTGINGKLSNLSTTVEDITTAANYSEEVHVGGKHENETTSTISEFLFFLNRYMYTEFQ